LGARGTDRAPIKVAGLYEAIPAAYFSWIKLFRETNLRYPVLMSDLRDLDIMNEAINSTHLQKLIEGFQRYLPEVLR